MIDDEKYIKFAQETVQSTINKFTKALQDQDFFSCAKALGILEFYRTSDLDSFTGMAFQMNKDYEKSAMYFKRVSKKSPLYAESMKGLAINYVFLGRYLELDSLLATGAYQCSPMEELNIRLKCLTNVPNDYFSRNASDLENCKARIVPLDYDIETESDSLFDICKIFSNAIVIIGECINQCSFYQKNVGSPIDDFKEVSDISRFVQEYEKWCYILELSKFMKEIYGCDSLAIYSLIDEPWQKKVEIFRLPEYKKQIMQLILNLCDPEIHSNTPPYEAVSQILEAYAQIAPECMATIIDRYFDIIEDAYKSGESTAAQYIGYIYSEILATEFDPYDLKNRIASLKRTDDSKEFETQIASIKLKYGMSRKGFDAYRNACISFNKTREDVPGSNDYSMLSLQFFRVLEIEYCEKIIKPLAKVIDLYKLRELYSDEVEEWKANEKEKWKVKAWNYDINCLGKIISGQQSSFEVGAVRTMLGHLVNWNSRNDSCAEYLREFVENLLTDEGKDALRSKEMLDVIDKAVLEKYRVPGAHTGFLPYSTACESKDYVTSNLQKIITWFK